MGATGASVLRWGVTFVWVTTAVRLAVCPASVATLMVALPAPTPVTVKLLPVGPVTRATAGFDELALRFPAAPVTVNEAVAPGPRIRATSC